jgi:hypothetical protein
MNTPQKLQTLTLCMHKSVTSKNIFILSCLKKNLPTLHISLNQKQSAEGISDECYNQTSRES